jgi:hypothetical protein
MLLSELRDLLRSAVAQVSGVPDVVGPVLGRAGAFVQTQVNQVQTLQGALLGDLALEHQLRDRARYARVLAQSLGETSVLPVLDRLEVAHSATIDWLETRLAEVGRTGTSALKATPVQTVATTVRRAAGVPLGVLSAGVNRTGALLGKATGRAAKPVQELLQQAEDVASEAAGTAREVAATAVDRAEDAVAAAGDTVIDLTQRTAGTVDDLTDRATDAVGTAVESVEDAAAAAAERTEQVLADSGEDEVNPDKPPFAGYGTLPGDRVMAHVRDTEDVDELRRLLAFEQAHKARKGVLQAAQQRLQQLTPA